MSTSLPRLLVTRPAARQEPFASRARALGVEPVAFPCLEIVPDPTFALPAPDALAAFDAVLFTSRHAVEAVAARRPFPWPGVAALAIGAARAEALARAGQTLARKPEAGATSEALVAALAREAPLGSLLVVKGHGGRDLVATRQRDRGTRVETLACYRRSRPAPDEYARRRALEPPPDLLSVTSDEILDNLVALAGDALDALRARPLVVNSARGRERARGEDVIGPAGGLVGERRRRRAGRVGFADLAVGGDGNESHGARGVSGGGAGVGRDPEVRSQARGVVGGR